MLTLDCEIFNQNIILCFKCEERVEKSSKTQIALVMVGVKFINVTDKSNAVWLID